MNAAKRFLKSEDGPTGVEYAILLSLIIVVCVSTLRSFGLGLNNVYTVINSGLP